MGLTTIEISTVDVGAEQQIKGMNQSLLEIGLFSFSFPLRYILSACRYGQLDLFIMAQRTHIDF